MPDTDQMIRPLWLRTRALRRRCALRLLCGLAPLAGLIALAPPLMSEPVIGRVTVAMLLTLVQVAYALWVLAGHDRASREVEAAAERLAGQPLTAGGRR
jgi:hypothetical protein